MRDLAAAGLRLVLPLWAGLAIGISFLEAPVKFQAPSLTTAAGLDVGRHVFAASHLAQLALAAAVAALAVLARAPRHVWLPAGLAAAALLVQHAALLPVLDERARIVIAGGTPAGASPHAAYVALELAKVLLLLVAAALAARAQRSPRRLRRATRSLAVPGLLDRRQDLRQLVGTDDVVLLCEREDPGPRARSRLVQTEDHRIGHDGRLPRRLRPLGLRHVAGLPHW